MYRVKIYSLPGLLYQGTIRVKDPSAANIAKRMGGKIGQANGMLPTLDFKDGRRVMYRVLDTTQGTRQEETTNDLHP